MMSTPLTPARLELFLALNKGDELRELGGLDHVGGPESDGEDGGGKGGATYTGYTG